MSTPPAPPSFRDPAALRELAADLARLSPGRPLTFMHVCGTHENAIARFGLRALLPPWLRVIAGPGCPVCVCPPAEIDRAVRLALVARATVATFGDMLPVPGRVSLAQARAQGADVRVVMGAAEAVELARAEPDREVVMFAVGFETTACTVAAALLAGPPPNFSVLSAHRLIPPALDALLRIEGLALDGFLLPGHVLTVTGTADYEAFVARSGRPAAAAGFEPLDILLGLRELARAACAGEARLANAYRRAVRTDGNPRAREAMAQAFTPADAAWRGLGTIPASGLAVAGPLREFDAAARFRLAPAAGAGPVAPAEDDAPGCQCGRVMVGLLDPVDCPLFAAGCTPDDPRGPCMVSQEGTCRSRYLYREAGG